MVASLRNKKKKLSNENQISFNKELEKFTNQTIYKITNNLEKFNYNVIIANMYETYNFLVKFIKENKDLNNLKNNYEKILICFAPIIPHFSSECINDLGIVSKNNWPNYDKSLIEDEIINFVIQINGKKKGILKAKKDIEENEILEKIKNDKLIDKYIDHASIQKTIFVQNRLINILTK